MSISKMRKLISVSRDRDCLKQIVRPDAALAIWWRCIPEPLKSALEELDLEAVNDVSIEIDAGRSIEPGLRAAGYSQNAAVALSVDVNALLWHFSSLISEERLRIRLEVLETNASNSSFQAQYFSFRLICTYIGSGTQWCLVEGQDAICEVPTGTVGVFKGRRLLNPPAVLQRSPPIARIGDRRLVLSIDSVDSQTGT